MLFSFYNFFSVLWQGNIVIYNDIFCFILIEQICLWITLYIQLLFSVREGDIRYVGFKQNSCRLHVQNYGVSVEVSHTRAIKFRKGYLNNYNINNFSGSFAEEDTRELLEKKLKDMKG